MILLWGIENDPPLSMVRYELKRRGVDILYLNHKKIWKTYIDIQFMPELTGEINYDGKVYLLNNIQSAYFRPYDYHYFPAYISVAEKNRHRLDILASNFDDIMWCWAELTPALVLNKPLNMLSNCSKPYQLSIIKKAGFKTPHTILTNNRQFILDFKNMHNEIIYKSTSSIRSIAKKLDPYKEREFDKLICCPTQFQEYVEGVNCRVHIVGEKVFATKIISDAADYRYAIAKQEPFDLPLSIYQKSLLLSKMLKLPLCGIDFKITPERDWICFEVNPSPAYSYYEQATGQKISSAIADLLINT
jgi:hypothetical protein